MTVLSGVEEQERIPRSGNAQQKPKKKALPSDRALAVQAIIQAAA